MKISARINTFNEEDNIAAALESVRWADEILVVDSFSSDRTVEIARRYTDRVIQHPFASHGAQHNYADSLCAHDWILVLDADERLTPELVEAIQRVRRDGPAADGYRMARRAWYLGRWIRHSGWYPDWQTRLYRKAVTRWDGEPPHEEPKVGGAVAYLAGDMVHYTRRSLHEHVEVMNRYTDLASAARLRQGLSVSNFQLAFTPPFVFFRSYILKQGFRDGWPGLVIAYLAAAYVHLKQAKLLEKQRVTGTALAGTFPSQAASTEGEANPRGDPAIHHKT
ncbi:MAG TPA: glycosyltransferase family 2 protein [Terriglobales bacterium]|nr:glycosyltransferase family 2 protein [Terriglobales bacterium]